MIHNNSIKVIIMEDEPDLLILYGSVETIRLT